MHNAAVAIMASKLVSLADVRITSGAIRKGLETVYWSGRFELFSGKPPFIIDGAHNPAGAHTLRKALDEYFPQKHITFVLGILRDKDMFGIIQILLRSGDRVIAVAPDSERAAQPYELLAAVNRIDGIEAETAASLDQAVAKAAAETESVVCITGSLYLVGPAREIVFRR